jgi:hypothetical protein
MSLPGVFANKIDKVIRNNDDYYHENNTSVVRRNVKELSRYFDRNGYTDRLVVKLYYEDNSSSLEKLVLNKGDYFINIDNKKIYLSDVIDFEIQ